MAQDAATHAEPPSMWDRVDDAVYTFDVDAPFDFDDAAWQRGEAAGTLKRISRNGLRAFPGPVGGSGFVDHIRVRHGIEIRVANYVTLTMVRRHFQVNEPVIFLRAALSGDQVVTAQGLAPMVLNRPELTLICLPKGVCLTFERQGGVRQQELSGVFATSAFEAAYGLQLGDLPEPIRSAVRGSGEFGRLLSMPLEHRVASLVADTIDTPLDGEMRALQYAARLSELVAYTFDAIGSRSVALARTPMSWRDADLAHLIAERLARDYRQPPLVEELARELGFSAKKLQTSFKSAFGITMVEYCLDRRMREAQQLLIEAKLSVSQISERLGYAHQSSFAAAFSGHVGMSPSEYRRHRAPVDLALR